jgi:hypothetical protein
MFFAQSLPTKKFRSGLDLGGGSSLSGYEAFRADGLSRDALKYGRGRGTMGISDILRVDVRWVKENYS